MLNFAGESALDCMTNHLAEVGMGQEDDGDKLISLEESDNATQGEHSNLQGEHIPR